MATVIDELMIQLGLDGSNAQKGMKDVENSISSGVSSIKNMLGGLAVAFAGAFSVQQAFSNYLSTADSMMKFSRSIGQNIEDMHAWGEAVTRSGGSMESFQGSVKSLTMQLSKMATIGRSRAGNILESVGIDAGGIGRQRDALEVMKDIAGVMEGMGKAEAMGFGTSLGLDAGTIMLLQEGRDGVAQLVEKQKKLGTISKESAEAAEHFNDAWADTKQAFLAFSAGIFGNVVPALQKLVELATGFVSYLQEHKTAVQAFFIMIGTLVAAYLLPTFLSFFAALLTNPITWVAVALAGLALVIEDLITWAEGGESALGDLWSGIFGSPDEAKKTFEEVKQAVMDFITFVKENWSTIAPIIVAVVPAVGAVVTAFRFLKKYGKEIGQAIRFVFQSLGKIINTFANAVPAGFELAKNKIITSWESLVEWLQGIWEGLTSTIMDLWNGAMDFVTGLINGLLGVANAVMNGIIGLINAVASAFYNIFGGAVNWAKNKLAELRQNIESVPVVGGVLGSAMDAMGITGGNTYNNGNTSSDTRIGTVNVYTQATDANGVAGGMRGAIDNHFGAAQADGAY